MIGVVRLSLAIHRNEDIDERSGPRARSDSSSKGSAQPEATQNNGSDKGADKKSDTSKSSGAAEVLGGLSGAARATTRNVGSKAQSLLSPIQHRRTPDVEAGRRLTDARPPARVTQKRPLPSTEVAPPGRRPPGPTPGLVRPDDRPGPLAAARKRPGWVVLAIAVALVGAIFISSNRTPVYTADTRLSVGSIDTNANSIPGVVAAIQTLAASYARLVDAQDVLDPISEATGVSAEELRGRLAGSPIPETPFFFVEATGGSEESAVELANLAAESLTGYVTGLNLDTADSAQLLKQFQAAQSRVEKLQTERNAARRAFGRSETAVNGAALESANAALATAELQADAINEQYRRSVEGGVNASNDINVVNPAAVAVSDASSFRNRMIFTAVVLGSLVGIMIAWLYGRFIGRRSYE